MAVFLTTIKAILASSEGMKSKALPGLLLLSSTLTLVLPAAPGVTGAGDGDRVAQVLFQVISDFRAGNPRARTHLVQEDDLNAFLQDQLALQAPAGLEKMLVRLLEENVFITWLTVDMDQIDLGAGSLTGALMRGLFSGKQTLELEGRLEASKGRGEYVAQRAELNGMPVPLALLNTLLKTLGERVEPPFDPTKPFPLPHGIDNIRITTAQAILKTGQGEARP